MVRLETLLPLALGVGLAVLFAIDLLPGRGYALPLVALASCLSLGCAAAFGYADFRRRNALRREIARLHEGRLRVHSPELRDGLNNAIDQHALIDRKLQLTGLHYYELRGALDSWLFELIQTLSVFDTFVHQNALHNWVVKYTNTPPEPRGDRLDALRTALGSGLRSTQQSRAQDKVYQVLRGALIRPPATVLHGAASLAILSRLLQKKGRVSTQQLTATRLALQSARSKLSADAARIRRLHFLICVKPL